MSSISHCNRKWIRSQKYWCRVCLSSDREHVHVWLQRPVCERESVPQSCLCLPLAGVGGLTQTARPLSKSKWYVCRLDCSDSLFPPDRKLITDVHLLLYYHSTDHPDCPFTLYLDCRSDWYCIPSRSFMYLSVFSQSVWFCCQEARQRGGECVPSFCRAGPRTARDCHHQLH